MLVGSKANIFYIFNIAYFSYFLLRILIIKI